MKSIDLFVPDRPGVVRRCAGGWKCHSPPEGSWPSLIQSESRRSSRQEYVLLQRCLKSGIRHSGIGGDELRLLRRYLNRAGGSWERDQVGIVGANRGETSF